MKPLQTRPYMLSSDQGRLLQSMGASVSIKASSEQTGGVFNIFDVSCPPGYATPLHIHYTEDVSIYVLEGALTFYCGTESQAGSPGAYFFQPSGTAHGFRVDGSAPARLLYITFPAGLDRFLIEQSLPAPEGAAESAAARHKIEVLGPLPA